MTQLKNGYYAIHHRITSVGGNSLKPVVKHELKIMKSPVEAQAYAMVRPGTISVHKIENGKVESRGRLVGRTNFISEESLPEGQVIKGYHPDLEQTHFLPRGHEVEHDYEGNWPAYVEH